MSQFCSPIAETFRITSLHGFRILPIDGVKKIDYHTGLDIGGVSGVPIYAIADGEVYKVDHAPAPQGQGAETIIIKHVDQNGNFIPNPWGFKYTLCTHMIMNSCPVKKGDRVKKGQEIGKVGNTGRVSTGIHLHFELISEIQPDRRTTIDPIEFIRAVSSTVKEGIYTSTTDPNGAVPGSAKWKQGQSVRNVIQTIEVRTGIYSSEFSSVKPAPLALPDGSVPTTYSVNPNNIASSNSTAGTAGSGGGSATTGTGTKTAIDDPNRKPATRINEQAFLMLNWSDYVEQSKSNSRFTQFAQIDHDEPAKLNNILFKKQPKFDILLNTKSVQMSYFVPRVRIFKEFVDTSNKISKIVELPMSQGYTDFELENIFNNSAGRGGGVGLTSFNWTTIGSNSGNKYSFGADLELFFESIEEITKERWIGGETISFADLLIQQKRMDSSGQYNPDYYRVKALVGWNSKREAKEFLPIELIREIEDSNLSLYLGLHSHEIEIADDSTISLKLKFIAYLEALMDSPTRSNVFYSEDDQYKNYIEESRDTINNLQKNKDHEGNVTDSAKETISAKEEEMKQKELDDRSKIYKRIMDYVRSKGFIRYTIAKEEDMQNFTSIVQGGFSDAASVQAYNAQLESIRQRNRQSLSTNIFPPSSATNLGTPKSADELKASAEKSISDYNAELANKVSNLPPGSKVVPYFFLGDLFEAILSGMYGENLEFPSKEMKVFLGPVIFYDYGKLTDGSSGGIVNKDASRKDENGIEISTFNGTKTVVNIADIPLSLATYTNWFLKKIVDPGVVNMNFKDFVNAILNDLVIRSIGVETYSFAPRQTAKLVYKTKTLRRDPNRLPILGSSPAPISTAQSQGLTSTGGGYRYQAIQFKDNPFVDTSGIVEKEEKTDNFMFIYGTTNNAWDLKSNYAEDLSNGIRHIHYGSETGMIKNIKFKRQDNPLIRTHNMKIASTGNSDKSIILREVYNADVEMMGNSFFEIGELIYVSPTLFGSTKKGANIADRESFAKNLGIGGYFMILKINSSIKDGSYTTSLELKWNAKGDGKQNNIQDGLNKDGEPIGVKII